MYKQGYNHLLLCLHSNDSFKMSWIFKLAVQSPFLYLMKISKRVTVLLFPIIVIALVFFCGFSLTLSHTKLNFLSLFAVKIFFSYYLLFNIKHCSHLISVLKINSTMHFDSNTSFFNNLVTELQIIYYFCTSKLFF